MAKQKHEQSPPAYYPSALMGPSPILRFFEYNHLPMELQSVSIPFWSLAHVIEDSCPPGPEKSAGLRKLLEAKDCIVRAYLP